MRKLFNVKHRFRSSISSWGVFILRPNKNILSAEDFLSHYYCVEVFVFVVYIDKSEYSACRIIHGLGAHTECHLKGEYPTSNSIDIDILCFVIEFPVMFFEFLVWR